MIKPKTQYYYNHFYSFDFETFVLTQPANFFELVKFDPRVKARLKDYRDHFSGIEPAEYGLIAGSLGLCATGKEQVTPEWWVLTYDRENRFVRKTSWISNELVLEQFLKHLDWSYLQLTGTVKGDIHGEVIPWCEIMRDMFVDTCVT